MYEHLYIESERIVLEYSTEWNLESLSSRSNRIDVTGLECMYVRLCCTSKLTGQKLKEKYCYSYNFKEKIMKNFPFILKKNS